MSMDLTGQFPTIHWDKVVRDMKTTPTLQVVVNPLLARLADP